jgi:4-hydroxybenzoate polyprenyltransferase
MSFHRFLAPEENSIQAPAPHRSIHREKIPSQLKTFSSIPVALAGFQYAATKVSSFLHHEVLVTEALLRSNAGTTLGGFLFAIIPRLLLPPMPLYSALELVVKICVVGVGFQYALDIVNQRMGVAEDTVNKPYRPIPGGLISLRGADARWVLAWILFPLLSYTLSGYWVGMWALVWQAEVGFCYVWPKPNNPVVRNLFTGVATFIIISLVNSVVVEQHPGRNMPLVLRASLAGWAGLIIQIQEFHDVEGDRIAGKRTLPLVLGETKVWLMRYATCWLFFATHALFLLWGLVLAQSSSWSRGIYAAGAMQVILGAAVGLRVIWSDSMAKDRETYFYWLTVLFWMMIVYVSLLSTAM